ncbi:MAG: hypothetical protein J0653_07735, partial [Deltaproteobacteria bacterium]|nr:hypothetical protein [Deltaproteobacteria bacterium]
NNLKIFALFLTAWRRFSAYLVKGIGRVLGNFRVFLKKIEKNLKKFAKHGSMRVPAYVGGVKKPCRPVTLASLAIY